MTELSFFCPQGEFQFQFRLLYICKAPDTFSNMHTYHMMDIVVQDWHNEKNAGILLRAYF